MAKSTFCVSFLRSAPNCKCVLASICGTGRGFNRKIALRHFMAGKTPAGFTLKPGWFVLGFQKFSARPSKATYLLRKYMFFNSKKSIINY